LVVMVKSESYSNFKESLTELFKTKAKSKR